MAGNIVRVGDVEILAVPHVEMCVAFRRDAASPVLDNFLGVVRSVAERSRAS